MQTSLPPAAKPAESLTVAQLAKASLRRLAIEQLEPTPENYARAYAQEQGSSKPSSLPEAALPLLRNLVEQAFGGESPARAKNVVQALSEGEWESARTLLAASVDEAGQLADLIERLTLGVERGGKSWTLARKKDSLRRVLSGSRSDPQRLKQRLRQLVTSWESDAPAGVLDSRPADLASGDARAATMATVRAKAPMPRSDAHAVKPDGVRDATAQDWLALIESLSAVLGASLPEGVGESQACRAALANAAQQLTEQGPMAAQAGEMIAVARGAQRVIQHRHHLVEQLTDLCRELTTSMAELAESDAWARSQCEAIHNTLRDGATARGVKAASELLCETRKRHGKLRSEREHARDALKTLVNSVLGELKELGSQTGRFQENVGRLTDVIEQADTLESLTLVVREMVTESRSVHGQVAQAQARLQEEHAKASNLSLRVSDLESELRRLAEEVTTDQLTQVANRRGLLKVFDVERARMERSGSALAVALLDIDNFKRLNDELGHLAGDAALKALAARVSKTLRATDMVARYGGEEFVVLMPDTNLQDAQEILTRLQRGLSGGLFLHEQKDVLVTFSAGVTTCRTADRLQDALERADQALYEAKRTGKNRTCLA